MKAVKRSNLKLSIIEILSKNNISDRNELTLALQRVEELWNAQLNSTEGNEVHNLADLICGYDKKYWNSFFE